MIQYILECIAFQLVFLIIYDFFLKRETFFQWNRAYLIGTYILSLVLPWVKIEALKTTVAEEYYVYPEFLLNIDVMETGITSDDFWSNISWESILLFGGMLMAAMYFMYKLLQIYRLRRAGQVRYYPNFTRIVIANSEMAFSFFKSIFLGDKILAKEHESIIQHELVHIEQKHTWDLLFFELMRIIGWFNPLVYVYQNRVSELHEFIADARVAKTHRKEQYELLLSQVFQTENISFINQFFKKSLIKKRIVMLQKAKSKRIFQLKYLLLLPIILSMLIYSSCELGNNGQDDSNTIEILEAEYLDYLKLREEQLVDEQLNQTTTLERYNQLITERNRLLERTTETNPIIVNLDQQINALKSVIQDNGIDNSTMIFSLIDQAPVFPGCENKPDLGECFKEKMRQHVVAHFRYPQEAQEKGIQGKVYIYFVIDEIGNIADFRMRGPDASLEAEAERIIRLLPQMTPGKHKGNTVSVPFSMPISFKLQ